MSLAIEEKHDQVRTLITMGKERGYLLYDEVNDILPAGVHSSEEIEDLLSTFERYGIDIYEGVSVAKAARAELEVAEPVEAEAKEEVAGGNEEVELDLTSGVLERTNDPVRMYLREMGTVPLLKREGEVAIAKRLERGQLRVLKSISRSPIVLKELLATGEDLRKGLRSIKEIVRFDEEELAEEKIEKKTRYTVRIIDKIEKLYDVALMDLPVDKVRRTKMIAQQPISLETPIGEEEDSHLGDFIEDKAVVSPSDAAISLNLKEQTASMLKTFTPREERIIKMRFGLEDDIEHTLKEVGQTFAVSRERIRQIEAKVLGKLRQPSRSSKLRVFLEGPSRH